MLKYTIHGTVPNGASYRKFIDVVSVITNLSTIAPAVQNDT